MSVATTGQHNLLGQILRTSAGPGEFRAGGELRSGGDQGRRAAQDPWGRFKVVTLLVVLMLGAALAW